MKRPNCAGLAPIVSRFSICYQLNACQLTNVSDYQDAFQLPMEDSSYREVPQVTFPEPAEMATAFCSLEYTTALGSFFET